jgi:PEP-CTERM motif
MKALLASILAATLSSATLAATISFPHNPPPPSPIHGLYNENFVDTGFRFSPSCILDFLYAITSRGFELCNDNYLGPIGGDFGALYVDRFGKPFSLISVLPLDTPPCEGCAFPFNFDVTSNKGGFVSFSDATEMFFTGDEWRNITWLVISNNFADSPSSGPSNFVVSIPEPATLALIGIALVGLAFSRRRAMTRDWRSG